MNDSLNRFEQNKQWIEAIQQEQNDLLAKAMQSNDPDSLVKANQYWSEQMKQFQSFNQNSKAKSILIDPFNQNNTLGYRSPRTGVSYSVLRRMAKTPIIRAVIDTRIEQVAAFCRPPRNKYDVGFVIRKKKLDYTSEKEVELTNSDRKKINEYTNFFINCGNDDTIWQGDSFETFLRKWTRDMLVLDQGTFEVTQTRKGVPYEFFATDGSTFRMVDEYNYVHDNTARKKGYNPAYVQVYQNRVVQEFYPWEMCFAVRNPSTDITNQGYGYSELEILIEVITWMLYGDQYNGKFFSQGSIPKGILKVAGNVNTERLAEFRQSWYSMVRGVQNAWKIPIIDADKWDWIDLTKSNQDMQFTKWQEYLIRVTCAVFKMAPEELGIVTSGSSSSSPLFEKSNEQMLKFSKDKGLRPLLRFIQNKLNKYIQNRLDPAFEFAFVGIDADTEANEIDLDTKKGKAFMGYKELRIKHGLPAELEEGDFILDSSFIQGMGQIQAQEEAAAAEGGEGEDPGFSEDDFFLDEEGGSDVSEDDFDKAQENELAKAFYNYIKATIND